MRTLLSMVGGFLAVAAWSIMDSVFFFQTLLSRASQDDGWLVLCRMHHSHCILWVVHPLHITTPGHGTAVASADTSTTIFEVGRRRTPPVVSDVHHTNLVVRTRHDVAPAGARHIGSPISRGTRVGILSTTSARSDRRGADTCASLQARGARCRQSGLLRQRAAPDQEVVRREALGLGRFDVHPSTVWS
ncbi:hypothetical protein EVAR_103271_1 [Eumeta japonica]|uniref:Uncharacterized protein n=1 Tax=Eumeta variegata TaxID=151549 RepID=A0A4C1XT71_EUMVA|nr:hypothetical protein EVAR_103271_1 [Eumeta japonica]